MTVQIINFKTNDPVGTLTSDGHITTDDADLEAAVADLHNDGALTFSGMYEQDDGTVYYFSDTLAPEDTGYRLVLSRQLPSPYRIPSDQEQALPEPEYIQPPDFTDDEADVAKDSGPWQPYEGPQGGHGWQNTQTDEVRYQEDPPDETTSDAGGDDTSITAEEANNDPRKWAEVTEETYEVFEDAHWSGDDALTTHVADLFTRGFDRDQIKTLIDHGYDALSDVSLSEEDIYHDGIQQGLDNVSPDSTIYDGKIALGSVDNTFKSSFNDDLRDDFGKEMVDTIHDIGKSWADSIYSTLKKDTYPLYRSAAEQYNNDYFPKEGETPLQDAGRMYPGDYERADQYLRQYRRRMQEDYRATFGDTVPVFRGIAPEDYNDAEQVRATLERDPESVTVKNTVLNSWTTDPATAEKFARREDKNGLVLRQEVPVERIWMTSDTQSGLFNSESEFVIGNPESRQQFDAENIIPADEFDAVEQARWLLDRIDSDETDKAAPPESTVTIDWEQESHGWLHRLRDDDDDVAKAGEWERYHGPQGGDGWRHSGTGEIRYQQSRPTDGRQNHVEGAGQGMAWTSWDADAADMGDQPRPETTNQDLAEDAAADEITWTAVSEGDIIAFTDGWDEDIQTGEVTAVEPDLQNPGQQVVWVRPDGEDRKVPVREDQFEGDGTDQYRPLPLEPVPTDFENFAEGQRIVLDMDGVTVPGFRPGLQTATITEVNHGIGPDGGRENMIEVELDNGRRTEIWEPDYRDEGFDSPEIEGVLPDDEFAVKWEIEAAPDPHPHIGADRDSLQGKRSVGNGIPEAWKRIQNEAETDRLEQYLYRRIDKLREKHDHFSEWTDDDQIAKNDGVCRTIQGMLALREDADIDREDLTPIRYKWDLDDHEKESYPDPETVREDFDRTIDKLDDHVAAHLLANTTSIEIGPIENDEYIGLYDGVHREITIEKDVVGTKGTKLDPSVTAHELGHSIHYLMGMNHGTGHDNRWTDPETWDWRFRAMHDVTDESEAFYDGLQDEWESLVERERQEADDEIFMPNHDLNARLRHYQVKNGNEFFAVAFAHWVSDYAKLEGKMPGVAKLFDDYLGGGREAIAPDALDDSHIGRTIIFESMDNGYGIPIDVDDEATHRRKQVAEITGFTDKEGQGGGPDADFEILGGTHVQLEYGYKEYTVPLETMQNVRVVP